MLRGLSLHILLVEDDPGDAELTCVYLNEIRDTRFDVVRVGTLQEAVARVSQERFDAVLLDLSLPDASGSIAVTTMRQAAPDLPLIIMTGLEDADFASHVIDMGAQDYISKNTSNPEVLSRSIRYAISRVFHSLA